MARPTLQKRSKSWRLSTDTIQDENLETRVAAEFECYIHGALPLPLRTFVSIFCWVQEPLTQNVQITQKAHVLKELLHRWKSLGDSSEDRAVSDCNISSNTFTILTQVRQQQEGLLALLASSSHAKTLPCSTSVHSVLDRAATMVQEVATFELRCAWADLEHKADDLRPLAGGSQDGGSWKTAIEENKTFDQMVELGQSLLTLLDHDQLKGSIRAAHEALDRCVSQHVHPLTS